MRNAPFFAHPERWCAHKTADGQGAIALDPERFRALQTLAHETGHSIDAIVAEALDAYLEFFRLSSRTD